MAGNIVLMSGGLDSTVALYHIAKDFSTDRLVAMFFDYGQKSVNLERRLARYHASKTGAEFVEIAVNLSFTRNRMLSKYSNCESATDELPLRNLVFLATASSWAKVHDFDLIALGLIITRPEEGDLEFEDTSARFALQTKAYLDTLGIELYTPLLDMAKEDVLQTALDLHIELDMISSCNHAVNDLPCGECKDCLLLQETIVKLNN